MAGPPVAGPGGAGAEERHEEFFAAVSDMDEHRAVDVVHRALDDGLAPESVLLEVIAPAQARVGAEWAAGRFTVAREHAATAISDRAVGALACHPAARTEPRRGRATVTCVDGEWHAFPARLLAETLKLRGWRVDFLGAHVPTPHLIAHLHATGPEVVALSCSLPVRLPTAHATITACQAAGVPVLVGGAGFGADGRYADLLGADAWAATATEAADRLERHGPLRLTPHVPGDPLAPLPHLEDQEYTLVSKARADLVGATVAGLGERFPALRDYSPRQLEYTREDIGHVADFLVAALYTGDPQLFTDFLGWTVRILGARGVPAHSLALGLELMAQQLRDFPRALALLGAGRAVVAAAGTDAEGAA
ncbi:cobalamin B12-binding domain-containing protein [Streptomyces sp. HB2AG]|uniref:cobalamin B12-binding domain-containing protein n=1 Tax=Streptomyces sp. HB2AG TaxID=2983400 RepID=UPI003FA78BD8